MFQQSFQIVFGVSSILLRVARCQNDVPLELNESKVLPPLQASSPGIGYVKPMLNNEDTLNYQNFVDDEYPSSRDIDSIESNSNVNVNVNSNSPLKMSWNEPQIYQKNRQSNFEYDRYRRKKFNRIPPSIRLSPNSNFDYNFAHPDGNMRLERKRFSKRKNSMNNRKATEDFEVFVPNEATAQCYPIIIQAVKYLQRMENNMRDLEKELRHFLLGSQEKNEDDDFQ